ncbi:DegT/DnrJ/EryC1/StrS aminotransferase family protein [Synechococcus sp. UW69]|uniref:DegT/DnrJ/EryC1/StrS family aminotransferase n=1 Tax=Synechococcus sp. UW69 TaxID=368493 RepID=UPI000E0EC746|nr:DegT/DnrJ/EryC1/StrS family aminotransferase [Synechococcus sp. UW69]
MKQVHRTANPLACEGGSKLIEAPFKKYNSIGSEEVQAANRVLNSGCLSAFVGGKGQYFLGGEEIIQLEEDAKDYFRVRNVIAVNSWTSGLIACVGAIGIEPGDEIIVPTWTMAATATCVLHWNAIPVFADIDPQTFNIDPRSIEEKITKRTKAVIAVDIFGQSCNIKRIREITDKNNITLITDTAQSPGAISGDSYAGTNSDIGGFSLNYHKHIHCGEGGLIITNDDKLAERTRLIRNHGEAVIESNNPHELKNIIGYNFRLGEIEAAIAREQLKKLSSIVIRRQEIAGKLNVGLANLKGLKLPYIDKEQTHVYYVYGLLLELDKLKRDRNWIYKALEAEGVQGLMKGYANIHLLPIFQNKIAYGTNGFPWNESDIDYKKGICPVAERYHDEEFLGLQLCMYEFENSEINQLIEAFQKVWAFL